MDIFFFTRYAIVFLDSWSTLLAIKGILGMFESSSYFRSESKNSNFVHFHRFYSNLKKRRRHIVAYYLSFPKTFVASRVCRKSKHYLVKNGVIAILYLQGTIIFMKFFCKPITDRICKNGLHWLVANKPGINSPSFFSTRYGMQN